MCVRCVCGSAAPRNECCRSLRGLGGDFGPSILWPVSAERDELRELVERLPDEQVPAVLSEARRHLAAAPSRPWPPAFFGAGRAGRGDVAERAEEFLDDGFGRPA